jgi:hypothetical protein
MSEKQFKKYMEAIERAGKKIMASKETARAALMEAGIVDENGHLTEHYRPPQYLPNALAAFSKENV